MNAALNEMCPPPPPSEAPGARASAAASPPPPSPSLAPLSPVVPPTWLASGESALGARTPRAPSGGGARAEFLSLKRKQSFSDNLPPALQEFLDCEIDRVLAESTAELTGGELVGDHVHLNLSIPVPKGLATGARDERAGGWDERAMGWDTLVEPPLKKRAATRPDALASTDALRAPCSPPLTPPLSPSPASSLVESLFSRGMVPATAHSSHEEF